MVKLYKKYQCITITMEVAFIGEVYKYGVIDEGHEVDDICWCDK